MKPETIKNLARARGVKTVATCAPEVADRHSGYHVGVTTKSNYFILHSLEKKSMIFSSPGNGSWVDDKRK